MTRLSVQSVCYGYGGPEVLSGVTFGLAAGESCVLLGPNGSGKSTLLSLLSGLARPLRGTIHLDGALLSPGIPAQRRAIGFLSHASFSYPALTAEENLLFTARLFALDQAEARVDEVLCRVSLERHRKREVRAFSRGMNQRLSLARAILHRPRVLLLDEPINGLDPEGVRQLIDILRELRSEGTTILSVSHDLSHLADLADRISWLYRGKWEDIEGLDLADAAGIEAAYRARFSGAETGSPR